MRLKLFVTLANRSPRYTAGATCMRARVRNWGWHLTGRHQCVVMVGSFAEPRREPAAAARSERSLAGHVAASMGASPTGPRTPAGRAGISEAQRERWRVYRESVRPVNREDKAGSER